MPFVRSIQRKIEKSLLTRGLLGTLDFVVTSAFRYLSSLSPRRRRARAIERAADEEFDRRYGVDTGGIIPLSNLNLTGETWVFGGAYQAVGPTVTFGDILSELGIRFEESVFIDLGSGKGRAILLASELPFKRIVGVEFSQDLVRISENNVRRWPDQSKRCRHIDLKCMDAGEYSFPRDPFVLYMYNPFGRPIMERVVDNVIAEFRKHPRRIVVLYFTPKHSDLWEGVRFLKRVMVRPGYHVYDSLSGLDPCDETP